MKTLMVVIGLLMGSLAYAHGDHAQAPATRLVFANGAIHTYVTWEAGPKTQGESSLQIVWKDTRTHAATEPPGPFEVSLWMPSMGHGSAPTQIQRVLDPQGQTVIGTFLVSNIYFIMGGDWQVNVTLSNPDGTKETKTINVTLPAGGGHHH